MKVGVVVIGRNEGERLHRCLASVVTQAEAVVYVDSGSTDNSISIALTMGVEIVNLDMSIPFTAARARNKGANRLLSLCEDIDFIQFVDGDCEVAPDWLQTGKEFLEAHADIAMVCGHLRERHPDRSWYNLLCSMEWDVPGGSVKSCGGIAMMRVDAFRSAEGYRESMIAGEEPELCVRLRAKAWMVWRLDAEMALHDAAMSRFGQWWKRSVRSGHAYAEGAHLHGSKPEQHGVRESRRIWAWALGVPLVSMAGTAVFGWGGLCLLIAYPLQVMRLALKGKRTVKHNWIYALFIVLAKFPELQGQLTFWWRKVGFRKMELIEYK